MFSGMLSDTSNPLEAAVILSKIRSVWRKENQKLVGVILTWNPTDANSKLEDANGLKDTNDANDTNDTQGPPRRTLFRKWRVRC